jgi:TRAP-type uncharacterized transport system substrate-binding protein
MKKYLIALLLSAFALTTWAQQLQVATGKAGDTYSTLLKELSSRCSSSVAIIEHNSSGSNDNINRLVGNQVNAAFVQSDVLWLRARNEDLGNVKTLLALHPEPVHIVVLARSGLKEGGLLGIKQLGGNEVVLKELGDLAGRRIGAAGGSLVTAQVIRLQTEIPYNVVPFDKGDDVLAALDKGSIEAAIFVGGAPLGTVSKLGPDYKLIGISPLTAAKLKDVYHPARLNYSKIGASGVPTVATDALFVTREYKTAKMIDGLSKLRTCALDAIDELRETTGTHPAWMNIDPANRGKWPYYDFPATPRPSK